MASKALSFDVGDYVVYPKHGVGRVVELQSTEIAGTRLDLYVLRFEKEKMTLRVPVNKADSVGMRKLSSDKTMKDALETLKGKPKVKRTMWSRRAQEYEAKINSGDLTSIAEVVRDLFRPDDAPEQSYSERQIFEAASSRLAPVKPRLVSRLIRSAPTLDVMMMIVLRKSTRRPLPSVKWPSSMTCKRTLNASGCAFSISSSRTTEYGRRRTISVSCPPSSKPT